MDNSIIKNFYAFPRIALVNIYKMFLFGHLFILLVSCYTFRDIINSEVKPALFVIKPYLTSLTASNPSLS